MSNSSIYKNNYSFLKDKDSKQFRRIMLIVGILIGFLLIILIVRFVRSLPAFQKKEESITNLTNVNTNPLTGEEDIFTQQIAEEYADVGIPYEDPEGRFAIVFMDPFPSGYIGVVIHTKEFYDEAKEDADRIINAARKNTEIISVQYINGFE